MGEWSLFAADTFLAKACEAADTTLQFGHDFPASSGKFPPTSFWATVNPDNPNSGAQQARIEAAAHAIGMQTLVLYVNKETGFEQPFMVFVGVEVGGIEQERLAGS